MRIGSITVAAHAHLDIADLVLSEVRGLLRLGCSNEGNGLREPERSVGAGGAEHEIAT